MAATTPNEEIVIEIMERGESLEDLELILSSSSDEDFTASLSRLFVCALKKKSVPYVQWIEKNSGINLWTMLDHFEEIELVKELLSLDVNFVFDTLPKEDVESLGKAVKLILRTGSYDGWNMIRRKIKGPWPRMEDNIFEIAEGGNSKVAFEFVSISPSPKIKRDPKYFKSCLKTARKNGDRELIDEVSKFVYWADSALRPRQEFQLDCLFRDIRKNHFTNKWMKSSAYVWDFENKFRESLQQLVHNIESYPSSSNLGGYVWYQAVLTSIVRGTLEDVKFFSQRPEFRRFLCMDWNRNKRLIKNSMKRGDSEILDFIREKKWMEREEEEEEARGS